MIQAKDLRIGNWFIANGKDWITTSINRKTVSGIHYTDFRGAYPDKIRLLQGGELESFKYVNVEPIPLDEGWLIRAGFALALDEGDKKYYQNPDEQSGFGVLLDHHEIAFYQFTSFAVVILIHDEPYFQYVHHWQNITYALTGTELEFKPK